MKNIVLVHGGFVDGSGWEGVYKILKKDRYSVSIVQNPTISLGTHSGFFVRSHHMSSGQTRMAFSNMSIAAPNC